MIVSHNLLLGYKSFNSDAKVDTEAIENFGFLFGSRFFYQLSSEKSCKKDTLAVESNDKILSEVIRYNVKT